LKHKAKQRPAQYPTYTFQIEAFSHEGRGIAHYGTHPDHPKEKHGKKFLFVMLSWVKQYKPRLAIKLLV
jgi:hypothetical protein